MVVGGHTGYDSPLVRQSRAVQVYTHISNTLTQSCHKLTGYNDGHRGRLVQGEKDKTQEKYFKSSTLLEMIQDAVFYIQLAINYLFPTLKLKCIKFSHTFDKT